MYRSELGHIYQLKRDWKKAKDTFSKAEVSAETFSPPELKNKELARAKRGVGYSLIELGKLEEAEEKFRQCLAIDRDDNVAMKELKYIESIRSARQK